MPKRISAAAEGDEGDQSDCWVPHVSALKAIQEALLISPTASILIIPFVPLFLAHPLLFLEGIFVTKATLVDHVQTLCPSDTFI